jgi:hypothetical protein
MYNTQQSPIKTKHLPITQLFELVKKGIPRAEILKLFIVKADEGKILNDVKTEVFSTTSIKPEAILHPSLKLELFKPLTRIEYTKDQYKNSNIKSIDLLFKKSRKEQVRYLPMEELFKLEVPAKGNTNDLFNKNVNEDIETRHSIEDLFEKDMNIVESKISDLFKRDNKEIEVSPIDNLFEKETSVKHRPDFTPERPQTLLKPRSAINKLFDTTAGDENKGNTKIAQLFNKEEELNPFAEYAGADKSEKVWCYKDLKGNEQGPFSSLEMKQWNNLNYLHSNLQIKLIGEDSYKPLSSIVQVHVKLDDIFKGAGSIT